MVDRAAAAAGASAALVIDPAHNAEVIAKPYANINGDARQAMAVAVEAVRLSQQLQQSARDRATEADQAADRARKATNATNAASAARSEATVAGRAASMATNAAYTAGRAAAAAEAIQKWAEEATAAIHTFRDTVNQALDRFEGEKAKALEAERLAKEEAERKRQALNDELRNGVMDIALCVHDVTSPQCQELLRKVGGGIVDGVGATLEYIKDGILCWGGIEDACKRFDEANHKIYNFLSHAVDGFVESAKGFWEGLKTIGNCIVQGVSDGGGPACSQLGAGFDDLIHNPYKLIHLDVWHDDPGKAAGMTFFDVLTVVATAPLGGSGGALSKVVDTIANMVVKASTKLVSGLGRITEFAVRVLDTSTGKLANSLANVIGIAVRIENGVAKLDALAVTFDGSVFQLKPFAVQVEGDLAKLEGAVGHLEGGVVKFENGVASLEGAKFKFEPAPEGTRPPVFREPGKPTPDGGWVGKEFGQELKLDKYANTKADELLAKAKSKADAITDNMRTVESEVPGGRLEGLDHKLKSEDSLKRKLATELEGDFSPAKVDAVVAEINDAVRYTLILPKQGYSAGVQLAMDRLKAAGYQLLKFKNRWETNKDVFAYRGINLTLLGKEGQLFEFQLHTEQSFIAKELEHGWYDWQRLPNVPQVELDYARAQSEVIFGAVEFPDGAIDLKMPK